MNNQDFSMTSPPLSAEPQAKLCPMCGTLNHTLSRECFNCAWRGAFSGGAAALLPAELPGKPPTRWTPWWRRLHTKFFRALK